MAKPTSILVFYLLLFPVLLFSQNFPVNPQVTLIPPYSVYLSDYASQNADNLRVTLLYNDLQNPTLDIKLRIKIEGPGIDLAGYLQADNLLFNGGITRDQYRRRASIPDGFYRFCVQAFEFRTGQPVSQEICASAYFMLNDPPILNQPGPCGTKLRINEPQFLQFQWLPMHVGSPNAIGNVDYLFELVQIIPRDRNPNDAMLSGSIKIFETTTNSPNLIYGPAEPALIPGERYAWRVKAVDAFNRDVFKNQGYSQVCSFQWGDYCEAPINVEAKVEGAQRVNIRWEASTISTKYKVEYRELGTTEKWYSVLTSNNQINLTDVKASTAYQYRVQCLCGQAASEFAPIDSFRTRSPAQNTVLTCGQRPDQAPVDSSRKLAVLKPGDQVRIGDFLLTIVDAKGANGRFSLESFTSTLLLEVERIDNGLANVQQSVSTANSVVNQINTFLEENPNLPEEIKEKLKEAKSSIGEAKESFSKGDSTNGKNLLASVGELLKEIVGNGKESLNNFSLDLKQLFKNSFSSTRDSLERVRQKENEKITIYEKIDAYNGFNVRKDSASIISDTDLTFETSDESFTLSSIQNDEFLNSITQTAQQERTAIVRKLMLEKIISGVNYILDNEQDLIEFISNAKKDIKTVDITSLDLSKVKDASTLQAEIKKYIIAKISQW